MATQLIFDFDAAAEQAEIDRMCARTLRIMELRANRRSAWPTLNLRVFVATVPADDDANSFAEFAATL